MYDYDHSVGTGGAVHPAPPLFSVTYSLKQP